MVRQSDYTFNIYSSHVIFVFDMSSHIIINTFRLRIQIVQLSGLSVIIQSVPWTLFDIVETIA